MKKLFTFIPILLLVCASCEKVPTIPESETNTTSGKRITILSSLEQPTVPGQTKTTLAADNSVVWNEGDSFSILSSSGVGLPLTLSELQSKANGEKFQVILVGASQSSGCVFGSTSSSTSVYPSTAGMESVSDMLSAAKSVMGQSEYVLTLEKVSSSVVRIINESGNYLYRTQSSGTSSGYKWSSSTSYAGFTISTASSVSSSDFPEGVETSNCIQFSMQNSAKTSTYYLNSSLLQTPLNSGDVGKLTTSSDIGASCWYVYPLTTGESAKVDISNAGSSSAEFTAVVEDESADFYAVYPYNSANLFDGEKLYFSLPQTQNYASGSFASGANPSAGHVEKSDGQYEVALKNVCGVLRLAIKGSGSVTAIKVKDTNGASLWGSATVSVASIGSDQGYAVLSEGSDEIILNCADGVELSADNATQFNIVVPVGTLSNGFTLTLETTSGTATKTATVSNTIKRSLIRIMPSISTDGLVFSVPEFEIENPTAKDYMANSNSTFSTSYMSTTTFTSNRLAAYDLGYRNDQPNLKTISFASPTATEATVQMAKDPDFATMVLNTSVSLTNGNGTYVFGNMVPGNTYYYRVSADGAMLASGCFKAVGQLRMIRVDDGWNVRDLGGWTGWGGNKVRYENVYRGGSLGGIYNGQTFVICETSCNELKRIGIKAQLDLRPTYGVPSSYMNWVGSSTGAYALGYSAIPEADYQQIVTDWGMVSAQNSAADVGDLAYIIKSVKAGKPVYFHCRTGADRTGTVGYLLLALLGCDAFQGGNGGNQIAMDYELTSLAMDEDGTIAYNNGTRYTSFSNRQASEAASSSYSYKFFYQLRTLTSNTVTLSSFQERAYYYLNRYFYDNSVDTAGAVYIGKSDIDWFVNYMLGIVKLDGTIEEGHTSADLFEGPSWALDHTGTTLQNAIDIAVEHMYTH